MKEVHKDRGMASGRSRNVRLGVKFGVFETRARSTGSTTMFRVQPWTPLQTMLERPELSVCTVFMERLTRSSII